MTARRKRLPAKKASKTHQIVPAPNLLLRDFTADAPNTKWMADMTFIATQEGWLYLAGVIDAYSRKLVEWPMGKEHNTDHYQLS